MLKIRLARTGAKKKSSYRIVVIERERARDGRFVEILGHYNPRRNPRNCCSSATGWIIGSVAEPSLLKPFAVSLRNRRKHQARLSQLSGHRGWRGGDYKPENARAAWVSGSDHTVSPQLSKVSRQLERTEGAL